MNIYICYNLLFFVCYGCFYNNSFTTTLSTISFIVTFVFCCFFCKEYFYYSMLKLVHLLIQPVFLLATILIMMDISTTSSEWLVFLHFLFCNECFVLPKKLSASFSTTCFFAFFHYQKISKVHFLVQPVILQW